MESAWPSSSQQLLHPQSVGRAIDDGKRNEIAAAAATAAAVSPASSLTVSCGSGGSQNFEDAFRARAPHHHLDAVMSISAGNNGAAPSSSSAVVLPTGEEVDLASTVSGDVTSSEEESSLRGPSPPDIDDIVAQSMLNRDAIPISELLGDDDEEDDDDDQDDEDDDESVASSSGFVSRPSPLLLPNTSVGSDANPCPRPVADARLEMALDGQEPNVRNLIMAAIGVMKNRKARPDTKRICNWIHRRYGRPYMSISEELERLVMAGELARVDYKGSVSFRINSPGGRVTKRRKKLGQGLLSLVAKPTNQEAESGNGTTASPIISSTPPSILSDGVSLQVNLRTLVSDLVKHTDGFAHNNSSGVTITTKFISKAVESAKHNINRPFILANLEQILAKEVEAGHFVKVGPGTYTVQPLPSQRSILQPQFPQQPIPQQLQPMEPVAKHEMPMPAESLLRRPPSAFLAVSHKSEEERKNDLIQEKLSKLTSASFKDKEPRNKSPSKKVSSINKEPFYVTLREKRLAGLSRKHASSSSVASKNKDSGFNGSLAMKLQAESKEDAEKNALALPLLRAVTKGMGVGKLKGRAKRLREAKLKELQMMVAASSRVETAAARKEGGGQRRKKREEWQMRQDHGDGIAVEGFSPGGRPGSKREKKSRKIFDPADHDQPSRKRKISSVSPTPPPHPTGLVSAAPLTVAAGDAFAQQAKQVPAATVVFNGVGQGSIEANGEEVCMYCRAPGGRNFNGKPEILLSCRDCTTKVHPNCMDYTAELTKKILTTEWQCTNCKTCAVCEEANPSEDEQMLFCDSCDLGYHMSCHRPPVWAKPVGNWECFKCNPLQPPSMPPPISNKTRTRTHSHENSSSTRTISNGHKGETMDEQTSKFLPILPPHLHPHTGLLPKNWEDYPQDPTIPDVADWEASQISTYFANQGFPTEQAGIFVKEEIDGKSLLLLHRQDVLTGLGLKLGPALKLFNHVKKLQTRRNFPNI